MHMHEEMLKHLKLHLSALLLETIWCLHIEMENASLLSRVEKW